MCKFLLIFVIVEETRIDSVMKKWILLMVIGFFLVPSLTQADSYTGLWKRFAELQRKDLPKSEMEVLDQIAQKATVEKRYGHLLKAELQKASLNTNIAPDSLEAEISRLLAKEERAQAGDLALAAVYDCALGKIYEMNPLVESSLALMKQYYKKAMAHPDVLAKHSSDEYEPLLIKGGDSKIFYDDLLHVIGFETNDYQTLHDYYLSHHNRPAACICAVKLLEQDENDNVAEIRKSKYMQRVDSLMKVYADLRECGELAIARYRLMEQSNDATAEDKMNYINYALSRWGAVGGWSRMNILRNAQSELTRPCYQVNIGDELSLPDTPRKVRINSIRNINSLTMNVYKLNVKGDTKLDPQTNADYESLKRGAVLLPQATQTRRYIGQPAYQENTDSMTIMGLAKGVYMVEVTTDDKDIAPQRTLLHVSDLYVLSEVLPDKKIRLAVVSATTGQPVAGAKVRLITSDYYGKGDKVKILTTEKDGEVLSSYSGRIPDRVYVYTDEDVSAPEINFGGYFAYHESKQNSNQASLFTDRSIYRRGQTVHVAVWAYRNKDHQDLSVLPSVNLILTLRDANHKEVRTQRVETDSYGTASADFILPSAGLTGQYTITCTGPSQGWTSFSVEDYKRPTYEVEFDKVTTGYQSGDTLRLTGRAHSYAGVPVQGAKVKFSVQRRPSFWWWYRGKNDTRTLAEDTLQTDAQGQFVVKVPMVLPEDIDAKYPRFYDFVIHALVTDHAGESHEGEIHLPLSTHPTAFSCDLPDKVLRDSLKTIRFSYKNNAGEEIPGLVNYTLDGKSYTGKANEVIANSHLTGLSSGVHHLVAICGQDTLRKEVVVFSMSDRKPVVENHDWFYQSSKAFPQNGKPVYVQIGSSDPDQHIFYTIFSGKAVLEHGVIKQSNALTTRHFSYKEEYGNGILITYAWVKGGKLYHHEAGIQRPLPDKHLTVKWTTFRDKLTPGQKEEWTLTITRPDGKPAKAQLLATLYDQSLDPIKKHDWTFAPSLFQNLPSARWWGGYFNATGLYGFQGFKPLQENELDFTHFDTTVFNFIPVAQEEVMVMGSGKPSHRSRTMAKTSLMNVMIKKDSAVKPEAAPPVGATAEMVEDSEETAASGQVRENLNETAFFYPALETDDKGNVAVRFTLPESVTTWRFLGLAHDAEMDYGYIDGKAVAQKTVMVQPNMPRFLRTGDQAQLATRISNTSDKQASGVATLQLIDPATERVVFTQRHPFQVMTHETTTVGFDVDMDRVKSYENSLLVCKITAAGKGFSDGEQHYLPIMPEQEQVVTTVPFTQHGAGTEQIDLTKLFPTGSKDKKLTVEYTNNPTWLMIQALPALSSPTTDDVISQAAAYYSNSMAGHLLKSASQIQSTIELWKQEKGTETSLIGQLEKDQDLKTLVLDETPWVMDAKKETDQKQQLLQYFDESALGYRLSSSLSKMKKLQNPDGSWSWWPGMPGSLYMTTAVSEMMVRLNALIGKQDDTSTLLYAAFRYMGKKIAEEVAEMKKAEKKGVKNVRPSETAVHYLYLCALDGRKLPASQQSDVAYLVQHLAKQPTAFTIYGKALAAVIFGKSSHDTALAKQYLQSLMEYSVYRKETGRYFDTPKAYYSWFDYRIPTQVAAIEALKLLRPQDYQTIEEMQRWLLQEKRTTSWSTPINSVDAVYAFLDGETGKLSRQGESTVLKVDGKVLESPKETAGLGYVKTTVNGDHVQTFTAEKTSEGTSWGAVYAQFMQKTKEVAKASSGMSIDREIIGGTDQLKVGDKVRVRITIIADRDYDFVQVADKRAACLEPLHQLSGYQGGYYCSPRDNATYYYFDRLSKGKHVLETEYYVDRAGTYSMGTCTVQSAYCPSYGGRSAAQSLTIK